MGFAGRFMVLIFVGIVWILPQAVLAQAIPLEKLSLRLVPRDPLTDDVAAKTITINKTPEGFKLFWYSLVKEFDEQAHYPTYKIRPNKGVIEVGEIEHQPAFFHPSLWGNGYIHADTALPLWLNPEYLDLKGRQQRAFNIGLINNNKLLIKKAPDTVYDQVIFFQNLYDQYVEGDDVKAGLNLKKSDQRDIKKFIGEFFAIRNIARTKADIYVNQKQESYPAAVFGNDYFQLVVIDDPLNPLILSLRIIPENVPQPFRESFVLFKKNFEFRVTQVSF